MMVKYFYFFNVKEKAPTLPYILASPPTIVLNKQVSSVVVRGDAAEQSYILVCCTMQAISLNKNSKLG